MNRRLRCKNIMYSIGCMDNTANIHVHGNEYEKYNFTVLFCICQWNFHKQWVINWINLNFVLDRNRSPKLACADLFSSSPLRWASPPAAARAPRPAAAGTRRRCQSRPSRLHTISRCALSSYMRNCAYIRADHCRLTYVILLWTLTRQTNYWIAALIQGTSETS